MATLLIYDKMGMEMATLLIYDKMGMERWLPSLFTIKWVWRDGYPPYLR